MKRLLVIAVALAIFASCGKKSEIKQGPWLGVIQIDPSDKSMDLPINMNYSVNEQGVPQMVITNADEKIVIDEITKSGDTLFMKLPVFTSEIVAIFRNDSLVGKYYPKGIAAGNPYKFFALAGITDRFPWFTEKATYNVTGRWKVIENPGTPDSTIMVGEFKQNGDRVTGTFLNTTGDYRYLEGKVSGNKFFLSAVDGSHTFIITAELTNENTMENGRFMGSPKWVSQWCAERNEKIELPTNEQLVRVKKGYSTLDFAGIDMNGQQVTSKDKRFERKVVAVLAGGSWCPNCLDEARLFSKLYSKYKDQGFEVVALNFEDKTFEPSKKKMERFIKQTGANYTFLYVSPRGGAKRDSVLYPIEGQMAFPTGLLIDRLGNIRRVETGFSGPGTGEHYTKFVDETTKLIELLLSEK
ncbi:MAG: TlpA family protein disulfide reductase [Bacteroidales bacterium]|nr:MAG: TlpA family protein disulfide reductase [Bacteroidales bacterium]